MNRKIAALRVLFERGLANQFQRATSGLSVEQVSLHLTSVLAAALTNPSFILASITRGQAMALQIGNVRGTPRPVLVTLHCIGREEREALRRLVQALTWQVSGLVNGPVLPDASTVVRALITEWLKFTVLNRRNGRDTSVGSQPGLGSTGRRKSRSAKLRSKSRATGKARPRRRKPYEWTASADRALPHPDFPDVSAVPVDWLPGGKGRPPFGATRNRNGSWKIPSGFREIDGRIHPPLALFRDAASVQNFLRKVGQQDRRRRIKKSVKERKEPKPITGEAETLPQVTPEPAEKTSPDAAEEQPPQGQTTESPPGEPPSTQTDGEHSASPQQERYRP